MKFLQIRRGVKSDWQTVNPVLLAGELALEIDTGFMKIGDGVSTWNSLKYLQTPTQDASDSSTNVASTAFVKNAVAGTVSILTTLSNTTPITSTAAVIPLSYYLGNNIVEDGKLRVSSSTITGRTWSFILQVNTSAVNPNASFYLVNETAGVRISNTFSVTSQQANVSFLVSIQSAGAVVSTGSGIARPSDLLSLRATKVGGTDFTLTAGSNLGIVLVGDSGQDVFVRRDGTLEMTGNLPFPAAKGVKWTGGSSIVESSEGLAIQSAVGKPATFNSPIRGLSAPTTDDEAVNKAYVGGYISDVSVPVPSNTYTDIPLGMTYAELTSKYSLLSVIFKTSDASQPACYLAAVSSLYFGGLLPTDDYRLDRTVWNAIFIARNATVQKVGVVCDKDGYLRLYSSVALTAVKIKLWR